MLLLLMLWISAPQQLLDSLHQLSSPPTDDETVAINELMNASTTINELIKMLISAMLIKLSKTHSTRKLSAEARLKWLSTNRAIVGLYPGPVLPLGGSL